MKLALKAAACVAALAAIAACTDAQRDEVDSAAGAIATDARNTLAVLDIETGRRAEADGDIADDTDTFAPKDTIYVSVTTTGTVRDGAITSQWVFPDSSVLEQQAQPRAAGQDDLLFFITKPEGLARGKYTFRVLIDGQEVRSTDVTVQ